MRECIIIWIILVLNVIAMVYDILTFPIYYIIQQPWKTLQMAHTTKAARISEEKDNITWRTLDKPHALHIELVRENINSPALLMDFCARKYGNKRCLGTRQLLAEEEILENGKMIMKNSYGDYSWKSYIEVNKLASDFGKGIRELGIQPHQKVAIFAETRAEWMIAAHGLLKHTIPIVTIYANLGEEGIIHGLKETEVSMVITSYDLIGKFKTILSKLENINTLVCMEHQFKPIVKSGYGCARLRIVSFTDVLKLGMASKYGNSLPSPSDLAIIMYTSGSAGVPKGVMILHSNLIATMKAFCDGTYSLDLVETDCLIGFLPLAHVFELLVEIVCLCSGVAIGYSSVFTMIDTSTKIKPGTKGDASVLCPTIMTVVPLILDRISKGIQEKVSNKGPVSQILFRFGYQYKLYWWRKGYRCPLINKIIFHKVTQILGGNMKLVLAGGAPLAVPTQERVQMCLCVRVIQGYGLTETTCCATVTEGREMSLGTVGGPTSVCDIKLEDWDEGNYRVTKTPFPQGEIVIGGDNVSPGYFKLPDKTEEDFYDKDGKRWFKTGDIGQMDNFGVLKIIDRKKDLVKLQGGEYISLGKIEMELKTCTLVDNICIIADSTKEYCVALVVPNEINLMKFAKEMKIFSTNFPGVCEMPEVEEAVLKEITKHAINRKLVRMEIPTVITLCKEVWTPDNNLVTAAFKIRRRQISEYYPNEIKKMFKS